MHPVTARAVRTLRDLAYGLTARRKPLKFFERQTPDLKVRALLLRHSPDIRVKALEQRVVQDFLRRHERRTTDLIETRAKDLVERHSPEALIRRMWLKRRMAPSTS